MYPLLENAASSTGIDTSARSDKRPARTYVSVVIPCLNEEKFIYCLLEKLAQQYENGACEIIVVDGMSTDNTRTVVANFVSAHPDLSVRVLDNPARKIPAGLNIGVSEARGEVIVRMDAHSLPSENYVRQCLHSLEGTDAVIVGMPLQIRPGATTAIARAVALAVGHPFGSGGVKYRGFQGAGTHLVDTVPFGVFRKDLWRQLGGFNEDLLVNEDYEFNYRARRTGGQILLDTAGYCVYFARPTLRTLLRQYFRYGLWKAQMVKLYPESIKLRQLIPPLFVMSLLLLTGLSIFSAAASWLLLTVACLYALASAVVLVQILIKTRDIQAALRVPIVFFGIHGAWGAGFLLGATRWISRSFIS